MAICVHRYQSGRTRVNPFPRRAIRPTADAVSLPNRLWGNLTHSARSLSHRNFRLYWTGQLISLLGTFMQAIGQVWLVLELTHSPLQLGLVGALQYLPVLLFSLFGGVFADRWPKRRVLLVTQSAAMVQALLLFGLVATGSIQLWQIYILAMLLGLTSSLDQPARSAFVVEMVGREDLPNAVALNSSLTNLARVVGPGLGGLLIAATGVTALFLINALSFLAALATLALINERQLYAQARQPGAAERQKSAWLSLREGLVYVWNTPAVLLVIVVVGLVLLLGANYSVVLPLFASEVLHVGAAGFGLLSATLGLGSLLAALWLAWTNQRPTVGRVLIGATAFAVVEAIFALSRLYPLSLLLIAGVGFAETIFGAMAMTTLQTVPPDHLRGRVASVYILFFTGSIPPGYLLAGWLSSTVGVSPGLFLCALLCLLVVGAGWVWWRSAGFSAERQKSSPA